MRLNADRRKAFRELEAAGFSVSVADGKGEVKIVAPDGTLLGMYTIARRNRGTPKRLVQRVNAWERGSR